MNYDSSISSTVSLSRILDEMIMDGAEMDTILHFLKTHESGLEDIYKQSAFVYDLYDQLERDILIDWGMLVLKLEQVKTKEFFDSLVSYVDEHRNVFRMVFSSKVSGELRAKFEKMLEGLLKTIEGLRCSSVQMA